MAKVISEGTGAAYRYYPKLAIVVTAQAKGKSNVMAAAWHMPISARPLLYGVAISPKRFSYQLIVDSREFGVNFLPFEAAELIASVGGSRGSEIDKFQKFDIDQDKALKTAVPILSVAYAAYECQLVDDKGYGDHRLLVGEIVAVHGLEEAFTLGEILDLDKVRPALYLGDEFYLTVAKDTISNFDRRIYGKRYKEG